jgi:hypothetical protein
MVEGEADRLSVGAEAEGSGPVTGSVRAAAGGGVTFFAQPAAVTRIASVAMPTSAHL